MRAILFLLVVAPVLAAAERPQEAAQSQSFVIGISPFLDNSVKDDVYRSVVRLLVQDLPLNSTVSIYDAFALRSITQVKVPAVRAFESSKTRANQFASAIRDLKHFLAEEHPRPVDARLKFADAVRLPQFCDFIADCLPDAKSMAILLIGSPLYQDQKEPDFSMVDGYFPSDGHLQTSRDKSIFGLGDRSDATGQFLVHWVYFGDPWLSELYKEKVTRFWTLYLERRGGQLATFCGDIPTAMQGFRQGIAAPRPVRHWTVDPDQTKVEMLRIGREVQLADWIQRDAILEAAQRPPSVMIGPMKIGIRWKNNIDLDLYATPRADAETLFFQHLRSREGYYYKDHRSSPGREYEFIEFESPVDAREVEAFVNFYKGTCPRGPRGEVRIEFDGKIYSAPFSIVATEGNRGRSGESQQDFWTRLPVQQILKLSKAGVVE
jgi:hypothetical protein